MSLAYIAGRAGFGMSDVAFLSGLDESTVCRLREDPSWLDRIRGKSLQALISVLPGVAEYACSYPLASRRHLLADELNDTGLQLSRSSYSQLVRDDGVPEQHLGNALHTAIQIIRCDTRKAASCLVRFWGREQDYALGFLFAPIANNGLLLDLAPLIDASSKIVENLGKYASSFHAMIAQATLMHHVAKATGNLLTDLTSSTTKRRSALTFRSTMIGLILQSNDREAAAAYEQAVKRSPLLSMIECWSFPTYTHDAKPTFDFSLPPSLLLRHTADEILKKVERYNDAYLYYLVEVAIPKIIERDRTFGLRLHDLNTGLRHRLDTCKDAVAIRSCEKFLDEIRTTPTHHKGDKLDQSW